MKVIGLLVGLVAVYMAFHVGMMIGNIDDVDCYEDEVIVWDGTDHSYCVPLDDIVEGR